MLNPQAKGAADPRAKSFLHLIQDVLPTLKALSAQPSYILIENVAGFEVKLIVFDVDDRLVDCRGCCRRQRRDRHLFGLWKIWSILQSSCFLIHYSSVSPTPGFDTTFSLDQDPSPSSVYLHLLILKGFGDTYPDMEKTGKILDCNLMKIQISLQRLLTVSQNSLTF